MNCVVSIEERKIGEGYPTFIIAEAGVNHFGKIDRAYRLVDMAVEAEVDALKIQVYNTSEMIRSDAKAWVNRMKLKELSQEDVVKVQEYCKKRNIIFLASAHDLSSVDFLDEIGIPAFKIGSGELRNLTFMKCVAKKNHPVVLSTGMSTLQDVESAVAAIRSSGNNNLILLHCVTLYPTHPAEANLRAIDTLKQHFLVPVGYSDHTVGYNIVLAAVARGASVIEKHIALEKEIPGTWDPIVSCDREELTQMVHSIRSIEAALGDGVKSPNRRELGSVKWARKSIVCRARIEKGTVITESMLCAKRPGDGVPPDEIGFFVGKKAKREIEGESLMRMEWVE